jgi:hypothetical protein
MAGNLATMFLTHWLRAVLSAFGKEPFNKPAAYLWAVGLEFAD